MKIPYFSMKIKVLTETPFYIYNASAGSGKTHALVKAYLGTLFAEDNPEAYRHALAMTFTNKAVAEMKERILQSLEEFAYGNGKNDMLSELSASLQLSPNSLRTRSKKLLKSVLHNYSFFDVSTIDEFMHRVIRTFAFELRIPLDFKVEVDVERMLLDVVDTLIDKAGTDDLLTRVLVDFALEKVEEDKSWDLSYDLHTVSKLWLNEDQRVHLERLQDRSLDDFVALRTHLLREYDRQLENVQREATEVLSILEDEGLTPSDFVRGSLPKHFSDLQRDPLKVTYASKWKQHIETAELYSKKLSDETKVKIEALRPTFENYFYSTKRGVSKLAFYRNFLSQLTPISLLTAMGQELSILAEQENLVPVSEFNHIIYQVVKQGPIPFLYERLGVRYQHYFVDEFQDTSQLQWENLIPLFSYALHTEVAPRRTGTLMIVGDAKQSIYRWRGGSTEQFIGLCQDKNPFHIEKEIRNLPKNYRSYDTIVDFNNRFFKRAAHHFKDDSYKEIYLRGSGQLLNDKKGGYVNIRFIEAENRELEDEQYPEQVLQILEELSIKGYQWKDICILTRRRSESIIISEYLAQHNVSVLSSETLLLKNSARVRFLISFLQLMVQPQDQESKLQVLTYIVEHVLSVNDEHQFIEKYLKHATTGQMFQEFAELGIDLIWIDIEQQPLYEAVENIARTFGLLDTSDAYIHFLMDEILGFSEGDQVTAAEFLDYWDKKKDELSIGAVAGNHAVRMMTIHKAKGLEFPVVIFPYADIDMLFEKGSTVWFPLKGNDHVGFDEAYLRLNNSLSEYSNLGHALFEERGEQLRLDNMNLLYVALTRPVEQLYILTNQNRKTRDEIPKRFTDLFVDYLKFSKVWQEDKLHYSFGSPERTSLQETDDQEVIPINFISVPKEVHQLYILTREGYLWDMAREKAIERGNLIHDILSRIRTYKDIQWAFEEYKFKGQLNEEQVHLLRPLVEAIVYHPILKNYYTDSYTIYNEQEIVTSRGRVLRPDRILIDGRESVILLDYKTGAKNSRYRQQMEQYTDALLEMGYVSVKKILVYIDEEIEIEIL